MSALTISLLFIALGTFIQSCRYIPLNMVQEWSWESFSFVQGIICYLLLPFWAMHLALPEGYLLYELFDNTSTRQLFLTIGAGALWGTGHILAERSYAYLGPAWGKTLTAGINAASGMLFGALILYRFFYHTHPVWELTGSMLIGILVAWGGWVLVGIADQRRNDESRRESQTERTHRHYGKGVLLVLSGGIMAGGLAMGLAIGDDIYLPETLPVYRSLPTLFLLGIGAFIANTVYCLTENAKNGTFADYSATGVWKVNLLICLFTGAMEFAPLYTLSVARGYLATTPADRHILYLALIAFSCIFSYLWELLMQEWRSSSFRTIRFLIGGMLLLIAAVLIPALLL